MKPGDGKRHCYQCKKEIPNKEGKYFCSRECWELWGKNYQPLHGSHRSIQELQNRLLEIKKERFSRKETPSNTTGVVDTITLAKQVGLIE